MARQHALSEQQVAYNEGIFKQSTEQFEKIESIFAQSQAQHSFDVAALKGLGSLSRSLVLTQISTVQGSVIGDAKSQNQLPQGLHEALRDNANAKLLDDQLSTCMDWFHGVCRGGREEFDALSEKAQFMTDNIVNILRALLQEVDFVASSNSGQKRKRAKGLDETAEENSLTHGEERSVKRMRGILESSQDVHIRTASLFSDDRALTLC